MTGTLRVNISSAVDKLIEEQMMQIRFHSYKTATMMYYLAIIHCNTLKQDNDSTVRGDGGSRVGEVRASTTSPMPEHKGFKLQ